MKAKSALIVSSLFALSAGAVAQDTQDYTLSDALSGTKIPLVLSPSDIPDGFRPVKLTTASPGIDQAFGGPTAMSVFMSIGANTGLGTPEQVFFEIWPITWTHGDIVKVLGQDYVVTYSVDISPMAIRGLSVSHKLPPFNLKLKLIKSSDMGTIEPLPDWTKERYLRAVAMVTGASRNQVAMKPTTQKIALHVPSTTTGVTSVPHAPVIASEPAPTKPAQIEPSTLNANVYAGFNSTAVKGAAVARKDDPATYQKAQENARALASAMLLYAQDYDGNFPYVQSTRGADYVIYPYVKSNDVYKTMNPVQSGNFLFNMCLAGVNMGQIQDPANTPVFYDPIGWPNGTYLVAFADSHAKFLTMQEWQGIKINLTLKLKRTGKPLPADYGLPTTITGGH